MLYQNVLLWVGAMILLLFRSVLAEEDGKELGMQLSSTIPLLRDSVPDAVQSNGHEPQPTKTTEISWQVTPANPDVPTPSANHETASPAASGWMPMSESSINILIIALAIMAVLGMLICSRRCTCSWKVGEFELTNLHRFLTLQGCCSCSSACLRGFGGDGDGNKHEGCKV